jgi:hypothetical protein
MMAIRSARTFAALKGRLVRQTRSLLAKQVLDLPTVDGARLHILFAMDIQGVPQRSIATLPLGKPEGIRLFLGEKTAIVLALDFFYSGKRLRFVAAHTAGALIPLVEAINALERRFRKEEADQHIVLLYFVAAPHPYLLVQNGRQRDCFEFPEGKLVKCTPEVLEKKVQRWIGTRKDIPANL